MDKFFACFSLCALKVSWAACTAVQHSETCINSSVYLSGIVRLQFIFKIHVYYSSIYYLETFLLKRCY